MTRTLPRAGALAALALAVTAGPAAAHVTVQPDTATAGSYTVVDVRVPNETDDKDTTKVTLRLPAGFASVAYQPVPGWTVAVKKEKLATPVQTDDGPITEGVSEVTWSGGKIPPGAFQDFPLSVLMPDKAPATLTFKALQTYSDGEVVRWIGAPTADEPAPTVKLEAAAAGEAGHGAAAAEDDKAAAKTEAKAEDDGHGSGSDDDGGDGLAIAALAVGGLGLILGAGGLAAGRRKAS